MKTQNWTKDKPTLPGWYWVIAVGYGPTILLFEESEPVIDGDHRIQPTSGPLSTEGWSQFAGPLPEPGKLA